MVKYARTARGRTAFPTRKTITKTTTKRKVYRKPRLSTVIKNIALKQCETKRSNFYNENINLSHNVTYYIDNLMRTEEGGTNPTGGFVNNRVGNAVTARGLSVKLWISNKVDRPNVMYKIFLVSHPTRLVSSTLNDTVFWQGLDGTGSTMNRMMDHVAINRVKILKALQIGPSHEANYSQNPDKHEKSRLVQFYVSLRNKNVMYNADNAQMPAFSTLALAIVPYDSYGSLQTDIVASFAYNIRFYFKDP